MTDQNQYSLSKLGARLKLARESQNFSQKEVAAHLHLSTETIQILEGENTKNIPPVTFLRGYIRSYTRLLNFTEEETIQALIEAGLPPQTETSVVAPRLNLGRLEENDPYIHWSTTLILTILLALVGIWWTTHSRENKTVPMNVVQQPTSQPNLPASSTPTSPSTVYPPLSTPAPTPSASTAQVLPPLRAPVTPPSNTPPLAPASMAPPTTPTTAAPGVSGTPETPKKPERKRHTQDNHVSGVAMDLPEPGL